MMIVSLIGLKKCGKTTTAEALIREFKSRGYKVGGIKFMPNSTITLDVEGKDTWRHRNAGSDFVISLSRGEIGFIGDMKGRSTLGDALRLVPPDTDVLVCEGLIEEHPGIFRIVLARDMDSLEETFDVRGVGMESFDAISGIITNDLQDHPSLPVFNATRRDDVRDLVELIIGNSG